jgi:hypothetical protein
MEPQHRVDILYIPQSLLQCVLLVYLVANELIPQLLSGQRDRRPITLECVLYTSQ